MQQQQQNCWDNRWRIEQSCLMPFLFRCIIRRLLLLLLLLHPAAIYISMAQVGKEAEIATRTKRQLTVIGCKWKEIHHRGEGQVEMVVVGVTLWSDWCTGDYKITVAFCCSGSFVRSFGNWSAGMSRKYLSAVASHSIAIEAAEELSGRWIAGLQEQGGWIQSRV